MLSLTACSQQQVKPSVISTASGSTGNYNVVSRGGRGRGRSDVGSRRSRVVDGLSSRGKGRSGSTYSAYGANGGNGVRQGQGGGSYYGNGRGGSYYGNGRGGNTNASRGAGGSRGQGYYNGSNSGYYNDSGSAAAKAAAARAAAAKAALARNNAITVANLKNPNSLLSKRVIYFDYNQSTIKTEYQAILDAHAQLLARNPQLKARLEGHADERGTREYNVALSEERAKKVQWLMEAKGMKSSQARVVAYGEERPAVVGDGERSWAKNRRVEIKY